VRAVPQIDFAPAERLGRDPDGASGYRPSPAAAEITTFVPLPTEPVRVDTGAPDRITYAVFASLIGKAWFLRKHWRRLPIRRRLGYMAQILVCAPLLRALMRRWKVAALRRQRIAAIDVSSWF
jgi:hypothetical protein